MRNKGTKYDTIDSLVDKAMPVSVYARQIDTNPAYVCVKYDRYKFGYLDKKGNLIKAPHPGYDIYCWNGTNVVIPE